MRPLIGIPCAAGQRKETDRPIYYNNRSYVHAVERAGGVPILIPILDDLEGLHTLLPHLDGLLLSGGIDIDPHQYGEEHHPLLGQIDPRLDTLELALADWAVKKDIPTLGICRGMQLINVALGGSLYQDISAQCPGNLRHPNWDLPRNKRIHCVYIEPGSRMEQVLGVRKVQVNSLHHQAIKEPGKGVSISGRAEDGVAELLEVRSHRFMLAAQCHPEELYTDDAVWANFFKALMSACTKQEASQPQIEVSQHLSAMHV